MDNKEFGLYICKLRIKRGYESQRQLAIAAGLSPSTLLRIEDGTSRATPETLRKLASYLLVPYEELMQAAGYLQNSSQADKQLSQAGGKIKEPSPKYSATVTAYTQAMNILDEIEKEIKAYHERGIPIDRASVQKIVEHRRRVLQGEDAWIEYILDAKGIGEALERIAELDSSLNLDDQTMLRYIRKAKEKFGLPKPAETDLAAHGPKTPGTGVFDNEGNDQSK